MSEQKQFLVSVADALGLNANTEAFIFKAKTLLDSSIEVALSNQDVRAGFGNQLQFVYYHSRELSATLNNAQFGLEYIALNAGATIFTGLRDVYVFDEVVTLGAGGVGTVAQTPVGTKVFVKKQDGTTSTLTFTGSNFTVPGASENDVVFATYMYNGTVEEVTIDAGTSPSIIKLIMKTKLFDQSGLIGNVEIEIPRFQISGNFTLNFTADGVSSSSLQGRALSYVPANSTNPDGIYAIVRVIASNVGSENYDFIAIDTDDFVLGISETKQLQVYGIKTGLYAPVPIPAENITFTSDASGIANVSAGGLVTGESIGEANVVATLKSNNSLTDTVGVTVE